MEIVFVLWILCGVLAAIIASSKGRSVGLWAVIGILTGIVGVIIIACLPAEPATRH